MASRGNSSLAFRDNPSVTSSKVRNPKILLFGFLKVGSIGCPKTSARSYHYSLCDSPEERSAYLLGDGSLKSRAAFESQALGIARPAESRSISCSSRTPPSPPSWRQLMRRLLGVHKRGTHMVHHVCLSVGIL